MFSKEHDSILHRSKSQYCKGLSINIQTRRSSYGRPIRTRTHSIFSVYLVLACAPFDLTESCALVLEDQGATLSFTLSFLDFMY